MTELTEDDARRAQHAAGGWIAAGSVLVVLGGYTAYATARWYPGEWALPLLEVVLGGVLFGNGLTRRLRPVRLR